MMITPINNAVMQAPGTITPLAAESTTPPFPLNHARILYDNVLIGSTFDSSLTPASAMLNQNTWDSASVLDDGQDPLTPITVITLPSDAQVDAFCIGAHNIFTGATNGCTVSITLRYSNSVVATSGAITVTSNSPIYVRFDQEYLVDEIIMQISAVATVLSPAGYRVGYISAGVAMQMQRPFFNGHTPINLADRTTYRSNNTDSGELVGREIVRRGLSNSINVKNLDQTWVRNYFLPFREAAKTNLYFFAWNLRDYPNDIGLCETTGDIDVSYSGVRDLMQANWSQVGHGSV